METLDPKTVRCMPGKVLVEITEKLGGTRKSGLFVPGTTQDHMGKDTAIGVILQMGPLPKTEHARSEIRLMDHAEVPWPSAPVAEGDTIGFPRDVPKVFVWDDKRYGIIHLEEIVFRFKDVDVEVIPRNLS